MGHDVGSLSPRPNPFLAPVGAQRVAAGAFQVPSVRFDTPATVASSMNRFDRERIGGFREGALAVYNAMRNREDVPPDVRAFALDLVRRAGDANCAALLDALGVRAEASSPGGPSSSAPPR